MTPTEMGRRSDALYMDTNNAHRRQLCDMVVHREADIEELREEAYGLHCDIGRLEVENAKLRKFAAEAWELLTCNEPNFVWGGLQKKAHELGMEEEA